MAALVDRLEVQVERITWALVVVAAVAAAVLSFIIEVKNEKSTY